MACTAVVTDDATPSAVPSRVVWISPLTPNPKPMQTMTMAIRVACDDLLPRRYHEKKTVNGRTRPRAICCEQGRGSQLEGPLVAAQTAWTHVERGVDVFCRR